jgi:protein-tyrosine-phosphatase
MAEFLFRALAGAAFTGSASSAGLFAAEGFPAAREAARALSGRGIDLSVHRSRALSAEMVRRADVLLTMTRAQRVELAARFAEGAGKLFTLGEFAGYPDAEIADPFGQPETAYRAVAEQMAPLLARVAERMGTK